MSPCAERSSGRKGRPSIGRLALASAFLLGLVTCGQAEVIDPAYWLRYGHPPHLCPGAKIPVPSKLKGATWGVLASGVILCRDLGDSYAFMIDYLNVSVDPDEHSMLTQQILAFDWVGLAFYAPADGGRSVDWLFDRSQPVKGELRRDSVGRVVFGHLAFSVPKAAAERANHMLVYLTFGAPLVAIDVL